MNEEILNQIETGLKAGKIYRVTQEQLEDIDIEGFWYTLLHQRFDNGTAMITGVKNKVIDVNKHLINKSK